MRLLAGVLASALLGGLVAGSEAAWPLGFVMLVPWLRALDAGRSAGRALLGAWAMSVGWTAAVFAWFGGAIGGYTQIGTAAGLALLLLAAPLFQPQFLAFALVRHLVGRRHGTLLRGLAAAAAWVACERLLPRLLDDTLAYGLYPSRLLRQAAESVGAAGLTLALLLANEGLAAALARRRDGLRAAARPLAAAALVPLLLAGYGLVSLSVRQPPEGKPLRLGLVQSAIVDYDRLRREKGAGAVVREVLDTHYAMSYDAVERQRADAVLWSETVYPTTFGHPKSEAGAELDREILEIVDAARVPFVFGTFDRDAAGEYNAAAFVAPGQGLVGFYRKARPFPLTEHVPDWLDGPLLRRWLPWAGSWRAGIGARVLPLRLADGREIPVAPLICLDDMDTGLAADAARLGAMALLTLSNDSWFAEHGPGARLHLAAAAFRSIETGLPQFRVTANGYSAVIDPAGSVVAGSRLGERTLVVGELPVGDPRRTLVVAWGDWVGLAAAAFLVLLTAWSVLRARAARDGAVGAAPPLSPALPAEVALLPPAARLAAGALRAIARGGLLWMVAAVLLGDEPLRANTLAQIRAFAAWFVAPEVAAWCLLRAFAARTVVDAGRLVFARGSRRLELALDQVAGVEPWRLPLPGPGVALRLRSGARWGWGITPAHPAALAGLLGATGVAAQPAGNVRGWAAYLQTLGSGRSGWLQRPWLKFAALPLLLALPAFRLHQHIAYGGTFGEFQVFGLAAYLKGFALWWAAWIIGVALFATALRTAVEAGTLLAALLRPAQAAAARRGLERLALAALYLGLPAWLLLRAVGG